MTRIPMTAFVAAALLMTTALAQAQTHGKTDEQAAASSAAKAGTFVDPAWVEVYPFPRSFGEGSDGNSN